MNKGSGIISVTKENRGGRWTSDIVLDIYSNLLLEIWEVVSALVGEAILELLFNIAIKKIGEKYKFLNLIKVSEDGIIFNELKEDLRNQSATELHKGFQSLRGRKNNLSEVGDKGETGFQKSKYTALYNKCYQYEL